MSSRGQTAGAFASDMTLDEMDALWEQAKGKGI